MVILVKRIAQNVIQGKQIVVVTTVMKHLLLPEKLVLL